MLAGDDQVCVTSLPSVFMEREASELRRGRPTVATSIIKVHISNMLILYLYKHYGVTSENVRA